MSVTATVRKTMSLGGVNFHESKSHSSDGIIVEDVSVAAAEEGDLTTRTDDNTGVVTLDDSGHGFEVAEKVSVFWSGGCRRRMPITDVTGNAITVDGGSGDALPTQGTAVTMAAVARMDIAGAGNNVGE